MTKTELLNKAARNGEERLLLARVLDKLELARRRNIPSHTGFLSPGERACVEALLAAAGHPRHLFFGGYEGAQRNICVFLPDWQEPEDFQTGGDCPVCALRASFPADGALTHRDFLGSVLGHFFFQWMYDRTMSGSGYDIFRDYRLEIGDRLKQAPMGYFSEQNLGTIQAMLTTTRNT